MMWKQTREEFEVIGLEERSEVATSQGMLSATKSQKRQGMDPPLGPLEGAQTCQHLDFRHLPLELRERIPVVSSHVICGDLLQQP